MVTEKKYLGLGWALSFRKCSPAGKKQLSSLPCATQLQEKYSDSWWPRNLFFSHAVMPCLRDATVIRIHELKVVTLFFQITFMTSTAWERAAGFPRTGSRSYNRYNNYTIGSMSSLTLDFTCHSSTLLSCKNCLDCVISVLTCVSALL